MSSLDRAFDEPAQYLQSVGGSSFVQSCNRSGRFHRAARTPDIRAQRDTDEAISITRSHGPARHCEICDPSWITSRISWICVTDSGPGTHAAPRSRPASPPRPRQWGRRPPGPTRDRDMAVWQRTRPQADWFRSRPSVVWSTHILRTSHHSTLRSRGSTYLSSTFCTKYHKISYNIDGIRLRACATPSGSGAGEGVRGGRASCPMSTGSVILCTGCQCTSMQLGEQPHWAC